MFMLMIHSILELNVLFTAPTQLWFSFSSWAGWSAGE